MSDDATNDAMSRAANAWSREQNAPSHGLQGAWEPRPGTVIPPHDTRPVLWNVTAWLADRPRVTHYVTTWCQDEAVMMTLAQVRADLSLPPNEWRGYQWTVVPHTHEETRR